MVLSWLDYKLNGKSWEKLCIDICRIKYEQDDFQEVPSHHKGDGGIEGFTKSGSGIVIQCYCPDDVNIDINNLYESQRSKVTEDIAKLINNHERLKAIGVNKVSKWLFMVPEYKDKRILEHCNTKQELVKQSKLDNPDKLSYISEDFQIIIKVASDFKTEISRLIRAGITEIELDIPRRGIQEIDWNSIGSEKSDNVTRKMKAISPGSLDNPMRINGLISYQIETYIFGKLTLEKLQNEYPDIWSDIMKIESVFKNKVRERTFLSQSHEMNVDVYKELSEEFESSIDKNLNYLTYETKLLLSQSIVSSWLADCHMEFY